MKLQSKKQKNLTIAIIALAVIAVVAIVLVIIFALPNNSTNNPNTPNNPNKPGVMGSPTQIESIMVSTTPDKIEYMVGEAFNPAGASIQVLTKDRDYSYFVNYDELEFSGFDSSVANAAVVITVKYKDFTTTFNVKVKEEPINDSTSTNPNVVKVEVVMMYTTYTKDRWNSRGPSDLGAYVVLTYADGTVRGSLEETPITRGDMYDIQKVNAPGTTYITVKYIEKGETYEVTVPITITN